ncbi:SemiSWEET family transporter [Candidatus Marsarchaeota archaeon]|nr:SemiSWEET family transporter [Candidatus Marsarchaeota archaeon]
MMALISLIGFIAGLFLIIAYIPQVHKTIKTKSTGDISLLFSLLIFIGDALWITYGIILKSLPLIITNFVLAVFILPILIIKIKNDLRKSKKKKDQKIKKS